MYLWQLIFLVPPIQVDSITETNLTIIHLQFQILAPLQQQDVNYLDWVLGNILDSDEAISSSALTYLGLEKKWL